jgi:hypothetical protein
VNERDALIVRNMLNGVDAFAAARAAGATEAHAMEIFSHAMRMVAEFVHVNGVPFFPCRSLADARRHRERVFEMIERITLWDEIERDMMLDLLKGVNVMRKYGAQRSHVETMLNRTLEVVPHYLTEREAGEFLRERRGFVLNHRARVIEAVERFVSFSEPLFYRRISHHTFGTEELAA